MSAWPTTAELRARRRLTDEEVAVGADALGLAILCNPTAAAVRARAFVAPFADVYPGLPVWICMAQEHPDRHVYRGLIVSKPERLETGRYGCTAWVAFHANFPGRLLLPGRDDDCEWVASIEETERG